MQDPRQWRDPRARLIEEFSSAFVIKEFLSFPGSSGFFFLAGGSPSKVDSSSSLDSFESSSSPESATPLPTDQLAQIRETRSH